MKCNDYLSWKKKGSCNSTKEHLQHPPTSWKAKKKKPLNAAAYNMSLSTTAKYLVAKHRENMNWKQRKYAAAIRSTKTNRQEVFSCGFINTGNTLPNTETIQSVIKDYVYGYMKLE